MDEFCVLFYMFFKRFAAYLLKAFSDETEGLSLVFLSSCIFNRFLVFFCLLALCLCLCVFAKVLGRRSPIERASRSHAETGFCLRL